MDVEFDDDDLDKLETDPKFTDGWGQPVVRGYRKAMQAVRAAVDERDLYKSKGLRFEQLKGDRRHQHSLRINDQYRLIVELKEGKPGKVMKIKEITDYH